MTVEKLRVSEESYKNLYDEQKEKIDYLEKFIGDSTVERIKADKGKIETLSKKVAEQDKQIAVLNNSIKEKEEAISLLREQRDKEIKQAIKRVEREKDNEYAVKLKDKGTNERRNIRNKEVKPLEQKVEEQDKEIDRLQAMHSETMEKLEQVLNELSTNTELTEKVLELVKSLIEKGEPKEKIVDTIDKAIETIDRGSVADECRKIHQLVLEGKTQKEIANIMYPDLKRREVKVSDRIKSKTYQKMFNSEN
jgi:uncharacterized coiled-coil protein SlyX